MMTLKSSKTIVLATLVSLALISVLTAMTSCSTLNQPKESTQNDYPQKACSDVCNYDDEKY